MRRRWLPARPWMKSRGSSPAFRDDRRVRRLGLIVNPIAGMGGRVGLKGTDGEEALRAARERGATPSAHLRAGRALARLATGRTDVTVLAAGGEMGTELGRDYGWDAQAVTRPSIPSGPEDTRAAAAEMERRGRGADDVRRRRRTARDIHDAVGGAYPGPGHPHRGEDALGCLRHEPGGRRRGRRSHLRRPAASRGCATRRWPTWTRRRGRRPYLDAPVRRLRTRPNARRMLGSKTVTRGRPAELAHSAARVAARWSRSGSTSSAPARRPRACSRSSASTARCSASTPCATGSWCGRDLGEAELLELLEDGPATVVPASSAVRAACSAAATSRSAPGASAGSASTTSSSSPACTNCSHCSPAVLRVDTGDESVDRSSPATGECAWRHEGVVHEGLA